MKHNWEYKRLGDICESINGLWTGKTPPFVNVGVIRNTNFTKQCTLNPDNIFFTDVEIKDFAKRKLTKGDIIIEKSGGSEKQPVGRPILFELDGNYSFSNFTATLRLKINSLSSTFLHKALSSLYFRGVTRKLQSRTTGLYNLNWKSYLNLQVPVPPMEVHQQIVAELDKINEVIEDCRELLRNLDALAQSLFYDYFGDPVSNPKCWTLETLGTISTVLGGSTPKTNIAEYWDGDLCWITPAELKGEKYIFNTERHISELGRASAGLLLLPKNTVLLTSRAPIGKVAIAKAPMYCNQGFKNLICDEKQVHFQYVYFFLSLITDILNEKGSGATFKEISKRVTESISIPVPPLELQEKFAERIEQIDAQKKAVEETIAELQTLLDSRMDYWFN